MAANSLLYLLLTAGLTTPPEQSVTTESIFDITTEYTRQPSYDSIKDASQWPFQTKWSANGGHSEDAEIGWRQEPRYSTENPSHQYTSPPVTENEHADWNIWSKIKRPFEQSRDKTYQPHDWPLETEEPQYKAERHGNWPLPTIEPEDRIDRPRAQHQQRNANADWRAVWSQTERPFEESEDETDLPYDWPSATDEPQHKAGHWNWPLATEEPEDETERPVAWSQKKGRSKCPEREHFSKCHKNCEKTCSNHTKRKPCPRSCKKGCVCDSGLVRNKGGKCVPRDQCPGKLMAEDDNSHGCPYEYMCDVHCITGGRKSGHCKGNICKCSDK